MQCFKMESGCSNGDIDTCLFWAKMQKMAGALSSSRGRAAAVKSPLRIVMRCLTILCLAAFISLVVAALACFRPPLTIKLGKQSVAVDVQTLGEYPSNLSHLKISDASDHHPVVEIFSVGEQQFRTLVLTSAGDCIWAMDPEGEHSGYRVVRPAKGPCKLMPGRRYKVEVWGHDDLTLTKRTSEFRMPG